MYVLNTNLTVTEYLSRQYEDSEIEVSLLLVSFLGESRDPYGLQFQGLIQWSHHSIFNVSINSKMKIKFHLAYTITVMRSM